MLKNVFSSGDIFEFEAMKKIGEKGYARGDCIMDLRQCNQCGVLYNFAFDVSKMLKAYSNKAYYQQKNFTSRLNKTLIQIKDKIISHAKKDSIFLEIAPGLCDLLFALAKEVKFIYSVDPSHTSLIAKDLKNVMHIQSFFEAKKIRSILKDEKVDFIVFRHLLEHIEKPNEFLKEVVDFLDFGGKIYLEVPNTLEIFKHKKFYEFFHDHVSFFEENTLVNVLSKLNCVLIDKHYLYDEQWMGLIFEKRFDVKELNLEVKFFNEKNYFQREVKMLNDFLKSFENVAFMGAGIHSNTMLGFIDEKNLVKLKYCFDLNPEKIGRFLQNSSIKIINASKESLKDIECIIMTMALHEKVVFENEILNFKKQGLAPKLKAVILSAKELRLVNLKENGC